MRGVELVNLDRHRDPRGSLLTFAGSALPFDVKNVYFILDAPPGTVRAAHANSGDSAIIALSPSVTVDLDNGAERESHLLNGPYTALIVRAGVWLRLREFTEGSRIVVLASVPFEEMTRFDEPEPALIADFEG